MKFENIKVGDEVFVQVAYKYGWNGCKTFTLAKKVIKVTATQFTTEDKTRFYKESGSGIGNNTYAYKTGDKPWGEDAIVADESHLLEEFKNKLKIEHDINEELSKLKLSKNSKFNTIELTSILNDVKALKEKLS